MTRQGCALIHPAWTLSSSGVGFLLWMLDSLTTGLGNFPAIPRFVGGPSLNADGPWSNLLLRLRFPVGFFPAALVVAHMALGVGWLVRRAQSLRSLVGVAARSSSSSSARAS